MTLPMKSFYSLEHSECVSCFLSLMYKKLFFSGSLTKQEKQCHDHKTQIFALTTEHKKVCVMYIEGVMFENRM